MTSEPPPHGTASAKPVPFVRTGRPDFIGRIAAALTVELIIVSVAAGHAVAVAVNLASLVSPISWTVPLFGVGWVLISLLFPRPAGSGERNPRIARVVGSVLISLAFVALVSTVLALGWILGTWSVSVAFDGVAIVAGMAAYLRSRPRSRHRLSPPGRRSFPAILTAALAVLLFVIWRWTTTYPVVNGWDMMTSLVTVDFMQSHGGFAYVLIPPFPSSGAIPYPGMFLDVLAGLGLYLGLPPLLVFWWAPLFLIASVAGLIFALVMRFSARPWLAALVAFVAVILSAPQGESVRSPLYLSPDAVAELLFLLFITWYVHTQAGFRWRGWSAAFFLIFLGIFYFYSLVAAFPFLVAMVVGARRLPVVRSALRLFLLLETVTLAGLVGIYVLAPSAGSALSQFADPTILPTFSKLGLLFSIYSPITWLPFGAAALVFYMNRSTVGTEPLSLWFFGVGALFCFLGILVPLWVSYRLEFYMRSMLLIFLASFGLGPFPWPSGLARRWSRERRSPRPLMTVSHRDAVALAVCFLVPAVILFPAFLDYSHSYNAYYSTDEYNAALWIRSNLPADAYLATDPGSGYFFRGLAHRNASIYFILGDGRAPWDSSQLYPDLNARLHVAFTQPNAYFVMRDLAALRIPRMYILLTSRTPVWVDGNGTDVIAHPVTPSGTAALLDRFSFPFFRIVFHEEDVYVCSIGV